MGLLHTTVIDVHHSCFQFEIQFIPIPIFHAELGFDVVWTSKVELCPLLVLVDISVNVKLLK